MWTKANNKVPHIIMFPSYPIRLVQKGFKVKEAMPYTTRVMNKDVKLSLHILIPMYECSALGPSQPIPNRG